MSASKTDNARFMTKTIAAVTMIAAVLCNNTLAAEPLTPATKSPGTANEPWSVIVTPYAWAASLNGNARLFNVPVRVNSPFSDTVKNLDFSAMGQVEVTNDRFGVVVDVEYTSVSKPVTIGMLPLELGFESSLVTAEVFFRAYEANLGGRTIFGSPMRFTIEPTFGLRYTAMEASLNAGFLNISRGVSWTDPVVGFRASLDVTDRWNIASEMDVGGFGVGSQFSANIQAYLGYRTTMFGQPTVLRVGYRLLHQNYEAQHFDWKVNQHGPGIGMSFRF